MPAPPSRPWPGPMTLRFHVRPPIHASIPCPPPLHAQDLVLLGGGHAHVEVLRSFGMRPLPGVRLTLVTRDMHTPYSGMLPGYISGFYSYDDCHIDLAGLASFAKARVIHQEASEIDAKVGPCGGVSQGGLGDRRKGVPLGGCFHMGLYGGVALGLHAGAGTWRTEMGTEDPLPGWPGPPHPRSGTCPFPLRITASSSPGNPPLCLQGCRILFRDQCRYLPPRLPLRVAASSSGTVQRCSTMCCPSTSASRQRPAASRGPSSTRPR